MPDTRVPSVRTYILLILSSLLVVGLAQAAWSLRLEILGTINTGNASMNFLAGFTNDDGHVNSSDLDPGDTGNCPNGGRPDSSCDPVGGGTGRLNRDVARCSAVINPGGLIAVVELEDVYPAYRCRVWFMTVNTGSLPLRVGGAWLNEVPIDVPSQTTTDLTGDQKPDLRLRVSGIEHCQQFDPGQQTMLELEPQLLGSAPQDEALVFTLELEFQQWNEPCEPNPDGGQEIVPAPMEESG